MTPAIHDFPKARVFPRGRALAVARAKPGKRLQVSRGSCAAGCVSEISIPECLDMPILEHPADRSYWQYSANLVEAVQAMMINETGSGCISPDLMLEEDIFQDISIALPASLQES